MIEQIFSIIRTAGNAVNNWFTNFMNACGASGYIYMILSIMIVARFLIKPLLKSGFGRSDTVSKKYNKEKE